MSMPPLPEQELVLLCARTRLSESAIDKIRSRVISPLDWDLVVETARRHGVLPLLYRNLSRCCPDELPAAVLADLRERFLLNTQRNLMLTRELLTLLDHLRMKKISAIPFKGPLLAITAYGDVSLRQIADVDLIVPKGDLSRARDCLREGGYEDLRAMDPLEEKVLLQSNCAMTLMRENPRVVLDLHWDLTPKYFFVPLDLDAMRARLTAVPLGGEMVRTFCPEELLLILCVHGARHVWPRLDWLVGVAELVGSSALDWDVVIGRARAYKCERMILLGLALARRLLDAELPNSIDAGIAGDRVIAKLSAEIVTRLWSEGNTRGDFLEDTYVDELHPLMFKHWRDRARYYAGLLFSPSAADVAALRLPSWLEIAYLVIRPIRLLIRFGPRWLNHALRSPTHTAS